MKSFLDSILYYFSGKSIDDELAALIEKRNAVTEEEQDRVRQEFISKN